MKYIHLLKEKLVALASRDWRAAAIPIAASVLLFSPALSLALEPPPGGAYPGETTALGEDALLSSTSVNGQNTALGHQALYNTTTGGANTAVGDNALHDNTTAAGNVAVGYNALYNNTLGALNVSVGAGAMEANTTALEGTAVGCNALQANITGSSNTAIGFDAMTFSAGAYNTAVGRTAMAFNGSGTMNVALGNGAMNMSGGSNNVALGASAGYALLGNNNIAIGYNAGLNVTDSRSSNNIEIGTLGANKDANFIRLGDPAVQKKTFIAGVSGVTVANGVAVMVNNKGQLGVATSSARYKEAIKPMDKSSEAILSLKPVNFRYKKELDPQAIPQFGLVAEDVAKVDPDLVARDEEGKPYTVRYEAVNAMLLNEFLKEHRKVEDLEKRLSEQGKINTESNQLQEKTIQSLQDSVGELKAALKAQAAQLQRVSVALGRRTDVPRLVSTNQ